MRLDGGKDCIKNGIGAPDRVAQDAAVLGKRLAEDTQDARSGLDADHGRQQRDKLARLADRYDAKLRRAGIAKES